MVKEEIAAEMNKKGISIREMSKRTGIKYELLRRVFKGNRKLTADELVLIVVKGGIDFKESQKTDLESFADALRKYFIPVMDKHNALSDMPLLSELRRAETLKRIEEDAELERSIDEILHGMDEQYDDLSL